MSYQQQITELDANIKELQGMVDLGKSLDALRKNRHFKKVVEQGYLEEEAVRLVHLKGNVNVQDERQQASIHKQIDSIGCFASFLDLVAQKAEAAAEAIDECEEARAELEAETD